MDSITQGVLGAAVAQLTLQSRIGPRAWLYGAIGGMAPDLDILIRSGTDPLLALKYHRHFTHSLAFIPIGGPLSALPWLAQRKHRPHAKSIVAATTVGYATHALLDAFTTYGTQLLWPLSNVRVAWSFISIVDLMFTLPLLIAVVLAARRATVRPVALGLGWCAAYMGWGGIQHARAVAAAESLAAERGHAPDRVDAFPNAMSNVAWRTAYEFDGSIFIDRVRTPWLSRARPRRGGAVPIATEDRLPPALRDDPQTLAAFRTFVWFTNGWIAADPSRPSVYGDMRYGVGLAGLESMWAITLAPGTATPVAFSRNTGKMRVSAIWDEIVGRDP